MAPTKGVTLTAKTVRSVLPCSLLPSVLGIRTAGPSGPTTLNVAAVVRATRESVHPDRGIAVTTVGLDTDRAATGGRAQVEAIGGTGAPLVDRVARPATVARAGVVEAGVWPRVGPSIPVALIGRGPDAPRTDLDAGLRGVATNVARKTKGRGVGVDARTRARSVGARPRPCGVAPWTSVLVATVASRHCRCVVVTGGKTSSSLFRWKAECAFHRKTMTWASGEPPGPGHGGACPDHAPTKHPRLEEATCSAERAREATFETPTRAREEPAFDRCAAPLEDGCAQCVARAVRCPLLRRDLEQNVGEPRAQGEARSAP